MIALLLAVVTYAAPVVAIADLANHTGDPAFDGAGPGVAGILCARFLETDAVRVVERSTLVALLDEQQLGVDGLVDPKTAAKAGRLLGADYVVAGEIFSVRLPSVSIALRVVDTGTGEVVASRDVAGDVGSEGERFFELVDTLSDAILVAMRVEIDPIERRKLSSIERRELRAVVRYGEDLTRVNTDHPMSLVRQTDVDFDRERYRRTHWMVYERSGAEVAMPEFARRVGDDATNGAYMARVGKLRRRFVRTNLLTVGYGVAGALLVGFGGRIGDRDGDPETATATQGLGVAVLTVCPFNLVFNLLGQSATRRAATYPGVYYTPDEADRWIYAYNRSLR